MANKRSAAGSRSRDLFRTEVSSLLADLGELAADPEAHPVPAEPPAVAAVMPGDTGGSPDAATVSPADTPVMPAGAEEPVGLSTAAGATPAPSVEGAAEAPPAPPEGAAQIAEPAASGRPEGMLPDEPDAAGGLETAGWPRPAGEPEAAGVPEVEDLISFSPSYLPPLPPVLSPLTAAPEPAAPSQDWTSLPEATPPEPWPSPPEPAAASGGRISPPELAAAPGLWPFPPDLSTAAGGWDSWPELTAAPDTRASRNEPSASPDGWSSPSAPELPAVGQGWPPRPDEAGPSPVPEGEWIQSVEAAAPTHDPAETTPAKLPSGDITAAEIAARYESGGGWGRAPSSQPSELPSLAELPGWRLDEPGSLAAHGPGLTTGAASDRTQRFRDTPPSDPAAAGEPPGSTADPASTGAQTLPFETTLGTGPTVDRPAASPSPDRADSGADSGWRETAEPQGAAPPTPLSVAATSEMTAGTSGAAATPARPGLPLLPGGQTPPVSTRPWTLATAMQPLAPLAPSAVRPGGVPIPESMGPVLSRRRSAGVNVPFAALVAVLVVVLVVIVFLIVMDLHR